MFQVSWDPASSSLSTPPPRRVPAGLSRQSCTMRRALARKDSEEAQDKTEAEEAITIGNYVQSDAAKATKEVVAALNATENVVKNSEEPLETIKKEKEDLDEMNEHLKQKVKELEKECETAYHVKVVPTCCMKASKRE